MWSFRQNAINESKLIAHFVGLLAMLMYIIEVLLQQKKDITTTINIDCPWKWISIFAAELILWIINHLKFSIKCLRSFLISWCQN